MDMPQNGILWKGVPRVFRLGLILAGGKTRSLSRRDFAQVGFAAAFTWISPFGAESEMEKHP